MHHYKHPHISVDSLFYIKPEILNSSSFLPPFHLSTQFPRPIFAHIAGKAVINSIEPKAYGSTSGSLAGKDGAPYAFGSMELFFFLTFYWSND